MPSPPRENADIDLSESLSVSANGSGQTVSKQPHHKGCKIIVQKIAAACAALLLTAVLLTWFVVWRILTLQEVIDDRVLAVAFWLLGVTLCVNTIGHCGKGDAWSNAADEWEHYTGPASCSFVDVSGLFTIVVPIVAICGRWILQHSHYRHERCISPTLLLHGVVLLFGATCVYKHTHTICSDEQLQLCGRPWVELPLLLLGDMALVAAWSSHFWLPVTYDRQMQAEKLLIDSRVGGPGAQNATRISHNRQTVLPYRQYVLAGLGTIESGPNSSTADVDTGVIVLIHGLGSGNGHWCEQMVELSQDNRLLCVEWRGCGRSDRSSFSAKTHAETLQWFLPAFAAWFDAAGLTSKRVTLVGHSMGAIMACEFCWRYPEQVGAVVLASPAGVGLEGADDLFAEEAAGEQGDSMTTAIMSTLVPTLWRWGYTPFLVLRLLGPLGRHVVRPAMYWRLSATNLGSHTRDAIVEPIQSYLNEYMYQSLADKPSGEQAMTTLLHPDTRGVEPLGPKLIEKAAWHAKYCIGVHFIYGGPSDWMVSDTGKEVVEQLQLLGATASHTVLYEAGHYVMLDDPDSLNPVILQISKDVQQQQIVARGSTPSGGKWLGAVP